MDKKQNILNKRSFEQAGKDLLRKVHDAESDNLQEALASWQEIEARTTQPRTSFRLRSRYILSVAASIAVLLSVGLYFWMDTKSDTSMSLALLENNTSSLSGDEIVLIESDDKMQLKDESSIKYDVDGKSNVEQHVVKKEIAEEKKEKIRAFYQSEEQREKYLPDYPDYNWKQVMRMTHMEWFSYDIVQYLQDGILHEKKTLVLFDYQKRNPLSYQAKVQIVREQVTE